MNIVRNTLGALGLLFLGATGAQADRLEDYQGRDHIPDTPSTNCARQVLLNLKGSGDQFFQDAYKENGDPVYLFMLAHEGGAETQIDVKPGHNDSFEFSAYRGDISDRMTKVARELQRVCPELTNVAPS